MLRTSPVLKNERWRAAMPSVATEHAGANPGFPMSVRSALPNEFEPLGIVHAPSPGPRAGPVLSTGLAVASSYFPAPVLPMNIVSATATARPPAIHGTSWRLYAPAIIDA